MQSLRAPGQVSAGLIKKTRLFTTLVVLSNAFGNLALAWGVKHSAQTFGLSPLPYITAILDPTVALGISLLIVWMLSRMTLLSWADLTYVLPVTSIGYVASAVLGKLFFAEQISPARWFGTTLIVAGLILVGQTRPNTTADRAEERT